jgi:hypothetical protein
VGARVHWVLESLGPTLPLRLDALHLHAYTSDHPDLLVIRADWQSSPTLTTLNST